MWMGGNVPLGYDVRDRKLIINEPEASTVRMIFKRHAELGSVALLKAELDRLGIVSERRSRRMAGSSFRPLSSPLSNEGLPLIPFHLNPGPKHQARPV
jgi:hypothetical protein